jgi:putative FmdB family regulatory protein
MPLYEYVCRGCGASFEALVRSWREAVACPGCRGADVEKQLSSFAFASAGGGVPAASPGGCGCGRGGCVCH